MFKLKTLFTLLSASAVSGLSAAASAPAQPTTAPSVPSTAGAAPGIFTLNAGAVPVTERTRLGERKLLVLEGEYARKLDWNFGAQAANDGVLVAMPRANSKTYECGDNDGNGPGGGGCAPDTDDFFE